MMPRISKSKKNIYLDHAATTYLDPRVLAVMKPFWMKDFGNPSSLYQKGRQANSAIESSRKEIAGMINAKRGEIIFTAGGTESVNLAIFGVARAKWLNGARNTEEPNFRPHFLASAIEHHAVLHSFEALNRQGCQAQTIRVDREGFIKLDELKAAIKPETILVSVMYANNEIGTIQPIGEIGDLLKKENEKRKKHNLLPILFHTDACQAAGFLDLNVQKLGVDLMSVNGSKIYGPKQTGFLYVRAGINLEPVIYGGGQERNLRSGTENVAGIAGLAKAFALAQKSRQKESDRLAKLRDYFTGQVCRKISGVTLNGPSGNRLPNNVNVSFAGVEGEALMMYLDSYNICVATGSACTAQSPDPSHVLLAIGLSDNIARSSIRFTLGQKTTKSDLDYVLKVLPGLVTELRKVNG
jgi:cysteine desulfurase